MICYALPLGRFDILNRVGTLAIVPCTNTSRNPAPATDAPSATDARGIVWEARLHSRAPLARWWQ